MREYCKYIVGYHYNADIKGVGYIKMWWREGDWGRSECMWVTEKGIVGQVHADETDLGPSICLGASVTYNYFKWQTQSLRHLLIVGII